MGKPQSVGNERTSYDPAFADAVAGGHLTPWQALQRGRREVYARRLRERYDLPMPLAYQVADNRRSLVQALRRVNKTPPARKSRRANPPARRFLSPPAWALGVAAPLLLIALLALHAPAVAPAETGQTTVLGEVTVVSNAEGQVVQVTGPNPRSVLRAYCTVGAADEPLEVVKLIPAPPRFGRARLGLVRHPSAPQDLLSVLIKEDRQRGCWIAGDGISSVIAVPSSRAGNRLIPD